MKNFTPEIINAVANVMAESFKEDRLNLVTFDGVQKKDELLKAHSIIHTKHAAINGSLRLLNDNPKAFIISFESKEEKSLVIIF